MNAPKLTRSELDAELADLASWVPGMLETTDVTSQMDAFAGRVELIEDRVSQDDYDHYWSRTQCILREHGLLPGDGEPCDTN